MNKQKATRIMWTFTIVYWIFIFIMTHIPSSRVPDVNMGDKSAHFIAYGLLATLLFVTFSISQPGQWKLLWIIPLICVSYGALDEWLQAIPFIHRSCELADWYADITGTAAGVVLCSIVRIVQEKFTPGKFKVMPA